MRLRLQEHSQQASFTLSFSNHLIKKKNEEADFKLNFLVREYTFSKDDILLLINQVRNQNLMPYSIQLSKQKKQHVLTR